MEQAGWLGHDYVHGRGAGSWWLGRILVSDSGERKLGPDMFSTQGGVVNGFSSAWWSEKHNAHHVYPNLFGVDSDIANDPVFHLWYPEEHKVLNLVV
jgi:hypothetical protein